MKKSVILFTAITILLGLWSCEQSSLVETNELTKLRKNLPVEQEPDLHEFGILSFSDLGHLESTISHLENQIGSGDFEYTDEDYNSDCMNDNKVLDMFEDQYGYQSFRRHYLMIECSELDEGVEVEELTRCPIPDDIFATLLNEHGEIIIEGEVYIFRSNAFHMKTSVDNISEVLDFRNGGTGDYNLFKIEGLKRSNLENSAPGGPPGGPCFSSFSRSTNLDKLEHTITWLGSVGTQISVQYDWGDGVIETFPTIDPSSGVALVDKTHTYSTTGSYNVIVTYFNNTPGFECVVISPQPPLVLNALCAISFTVIEGLAGEHTFIPINFTSNVNTAITKYEWDFGDGSPIKTISGLFNGSTSHTYTCNHSSRTVTLTIFTTKPGCAVSSVSHDINVSNVGCIDKEYDSDWDNEQYSNGDNKICHRTWLTTWYWPTTHFNDRVKAKMINYEKRPSGNGWRRERADLKIELSGVIRTKNPICGSSPFILTEDDHDNNTRSFSMYEDVNQEIGVKNTSPYIVDYSVDGNVIFTKVTDDSACN